MVNRNNANVTGEIDKLNDKERIAVLNYISQILSSRLPNQKENPLKDELIVSLQDTYENKRARQVFEWERVRRSNHHRAV